MAVTEDAVGPSSSGQTSTTSPVTWTHTAVGNGVAVLVGFGYGHASGADGTLTVTCDGSAMSLIGQAVNGSSTGGDTALYGIANRSSGAHTISVSVSGGAGSITFEAGSISYLGADLTTPFGAGVTAVGTGTAPAVTVTGTTAGNMVAGVASIGSNVLTNPATSRWTANFSNSNGAGNAGMADKAAGGSVTFTWSGTTSDDWGAVAVQILAAAATATASPTLSAQPGQTWARQFRHRQSAPYPVLPVSAIALSETGAGDDELSISADVALAESGSGSDALSIASSVALSESGAGSDALAVAADVGLSEAGSGSDALAIVSSATLAEAGSGTDSLAIAADVGLSETGAGSDALSVSVAIIVPSLPAQPGQTWTRQFRHRQSPPYLPPPTGASSVALTESGAGSDALSIAADVGLAESGSGSDALAIASAIGLSDSGAGSDALSITSAVGLSEAGSGSDALGVASTVALSESGTGADALSVSSAVGLTESGSGSDAFGVTIISTLAPVALVSARPGRSWLRRFRHAQSYPSQPRITRSVSNPACLSLSQLQIGSLGIVQQQIGSISIAQIQVGSVSTEIPNCG